MDGSVTDAEMLDRLSAHYRQLKREIAKVIVGQQPAVDSLLNAVFSGGHCLLVGVPGLAKTLLVNTLSRTLGLGYSRIQFTPDLMPSDIVGSEILDENRRFKFVKGPVFSNIVLADEINRTPPKTQAALLEAMQERMVTVSGTTYPLPSPFFVLATQNPIEQEGTYPLPEAQLDRFMFNVRLDYPSFDDEVKIVKSTTVEHDEQVAVVLTGEQVVAYQQTIRRMPVVANVCEYAVRIVAATRPSTAGGSQTVADRYVSWGAGPRASQYLIVGAKTHAALHGKYSPDMEDVRAVAAEVLRHRIVRNYYAEAEGVSADMIVKQIIDLTINNG